MVEAVRPPRRAAPSSCGTATERLPADVDAVVLPGGFAHGDYLRTGAIARFSPVMARGRASSRSTVGRSSAICNGFQILCEAGLLPGALQKNRELEVPVHHR